MNRAKDIDWRAKNITEVAKDCIVEGKKIIKGTACWSTTFVKYKNKQISFPPPSPVALYLSLAYKNYKTAFDLSERLFKCENIDDFTDLFDFFEASMSIVIFLVT